MKNSFRIALMSTVCASVVCASGYRIPEQSLDAIAKAGASIASSNGADASYYNPANMAFIEDSSQIETTATLIHLSSVDYEDLLPVPQLASKSQSENFFMPTFHYISPFVNDWRFGLSIVAPGGLSKRWYSPYAKSTAEEFSLKIIELNPTASYKLTDTLAIGFGLRATHIEGIVKSDAPQMKLKRDLEGDSIDFGYNVALSYKPVDELTLSTAYRSKIDLTVKGDATLSGENYGAAITIPLPAVLDLSAAYTFGKTTLDFTYERTFWSDYKELDFKYDRPVKNPLLQMAFDAPKPKNWKDTNAYRFGVSHELTDNFTILGGFAIDQNPAPDATLGFELPDSDSILYSLGCKYKVNQNITLGLSYLYDQKDERTINNRKDQANPASGIHGTYTNSAAHLFSASFIYKF